MSRQAAENGLTVGMHELYVADSEDVRKVRGDEQKLGRIVSVHPGFVQVRGGQVRAFHTPIPAPVWLPLGPSH